MRKSKIPLMVAMVVLVAAFLLGLTQLFLLRFEAGDVYPRYSSLRADPLGTKAFYDSLSGLKEISVQRNYSMAMKAWEGSPATTFLLGLSPSDLFSVSPRDVADLESLVLGGGRLVVSFLPVSEKPEYDPLARSKEEKKKSKDDQAKDQKEEKKKELKPRKPEDSKKTPREKEQSVSLFSRWGFSVDYQVLQANPDGSTIPAMALRKDVVGISESISWHTALLFKKLDPVWKVVYSRDDHPVMIERKLGRGTLVISADSYLFSNQAMRQERHADLLSWMIGKNNRVIFDETHLGVIEEHGIATLIRKYRLQGLLAGLVLLAGLFVWGNASSFIPSREQRVTEVDENPTDRDDASGFTNLLRRNIPSSQLLGICLEEWRKTVGHSGKISSSDLDRIQQVITNQQSLPAKEQSPLTAYNTIRQILAERNKNGHRKY
jgi:hypothetical protein